MAQTITAIEGARKLGVGLDYFYSLLWTGKIEGEKDGRRWKVSAASLHAYMTRLREKRERTSANHRDSEGSTR